jgi:hypothetical protein
MSRVSGFASDERAPLALDIKPTIVNRIRNSVKVCFQKILYEEVHP